MVVRRGTERKKRSFGKTEEDLHRALKAAELLAAKLNLPLEQPLRERTFGQVAEAWFNDGVHRWRPGTQERYRSILRDFLKPLYHLPLAPGGPGQGAASPAGHFKDQVAKHSAGNSRSN
jgi:hypothetical protein